LKYDAFHAKANHEPGAIDEIHTKVQLSTGLLHDLEFQHERAALIYVISAQVVSRLCRGGWLLSFMLGALSTDLDLSTVSPSCAHASRKMTEMELLLLPLLLSSGAFHTLWPCGSTAIWALVCAPSSPCAGV
jgi:hypothetical protein